MSYGLTFNGVHCESIGLDLLESSRPILAENKDVFEELPFVQGSILISDGTLKDIEVTATFSMESYKNENFSDACRRVADWLNVTEWKRLIFDDDAAFYYQAKPVGQIDREQIVRNLGQFTVRFRCHPQMKEV